MKTKLLSVLAAVLAFGLLTGLVMADISNSTGKLGPTLGGSGGAGTPGGSSTQIQFNNGGTFSGDSGLTFDAATNTLTVGILGTGQIVTPAGSSTTPGLLFGGGTAGIYASGNEIYFTNPAGVVDFFEASINRVATRSGLQYAWSASSSDITTFDTGLARAAAGIVSPTNGSTGSGSFRLRDTSGSNHFTISPGDHTADRTGTWTAGTDTIFALDSGRLALGQGLKVGPAADGWSTEAGSIAIELLAKNTSADVEIHAEGGLSTGYAGVGILNDLLKDGSNLSRAAGSWLAHGSASASVKYGDSMANAVSFQNFGADSTGLYIGTQTIDPLVFGITTVVGSEPRVKFPPGCFGLTDGGAAAAFVRIDVPSGSLTSGHIDYVVFATTAGAMQTSSGTTWYSAVNRAGTETCFVGDTLGTDLIEVVANESGTMSIAFTSSNSPTNGCNILMAADSSLTTPTMGICFSVYKQAGVGAITPL